MKKIFILIVVITATGIICAQTPQKMSYQCVVRSTSGALVSSHAVGVRISILQGTATGTVVFSETYSPAPQTNANGLLTIEIGSGTASIGNIASIDWSTGPYYLKTETDPDGGTNYTITGTSQLLSVPYAFYAKTASNGFSGSYNDLTNKPVLFDGAWNSLTGKPAGFEDGIDNVDDADNSISNEIQALSISGTVLSLSNGGGSVTLPSSGGGDNWGTQTVVTDATLAGNGTTATPIKIAQQSATSGQVLKWDGTTWKPGNDLTGAFTLPFAGTTNTSGAGIDVTNSNSTKFSSAISGRSSSAINATYGVTGSSSSTSGIGVYGKVDALTGTTFGIMGEAQSSGGYGVVGSAISETGSTVGVMGTTASLSGIGVSGRAPAMAIHGFANSPSGIAYGVYGITASTEGMAIYGNANASTGINYGIYGKSNSSAGIGVYGESPSNGVYGKSTSTSGWHSGVIGESLSGAGVRGASIASHGLSHGIDGESFSDQGSGVYGIAHNASGYTSGVYGVTVSPTGTGVIGFSSSTSGSCFGVMGESASTSGHGVFGYASSPSGETFGIWGEVASPDGYSGYFAGSKFYVSGNVGIGVADPGAKLEVNGQIKITGGTPGAGKVLTSDATGLASWLNIPTTSPSGSSGHIQFNKSGAFGSDDNLFWNNASKRLGLGIMDPPRELSIHGGDHQAMIGFTNNLSGSTWYDGFSVGIGHSNDGWNSSIWCYENWPLFIGTNNAWRMMILPNGNVGIGKYQPPYKLDVVGDRIRLSNPADENTWIAMRTDGSSGFLDLSYAGGKLAIGGTNTGENILLNPGTNAWVGVRTWNPQYELDVTGNIRATGSVYYGGTAGAANGIAYTKPDYVFAEDYSRLTTDNVEEFVKSEGHLPWITSAREEKAQNGDVVDMTRMAFETVESVENMQMQIIEQNRLIRNLKEENDVLKKRLERLETILGL